MSRAASDNQKRVLVVEDDLTLRPVWKFTLSRIAENLRIDWAVSCEEALFLLNSAERHARSYCLIISDIFLAGSATGIELLSSEVVKKSGARTILVSTASGKEVKKICGENLPETIFLAKPLNIPKCERAIREGILGSGESL